MNYNFALLKRDLQCAVIKITEKKKAVRVPRPKLEAHRHCVMIGSTWQLQEAGGIEKDREGVGLHTGERQVALLGHRCKKRDGPTKRNNRNSISLELNDLLCGCM